MHSHGLLKKLLLGTSVFAMTLSPMIATAKPHGGKHAQHAQHDTRTVVVQGPAAMMDTDHADILDVLGVHFVDPSTHTATGGDNPHIINTPTTPITNPVTLDAMAVDASSGLAYSAPVVHFEDPGYPYNSPGDMGFINIGPGYSNVITVIGQARGARELSTLIRKVGKEISENGLSATDPSVTKTILDALQFEERKLTAIGTTLSSPTAPPDTYGADGVLHYSTPHMNVLIRYGIIGKVGGYGSTGFDPMAPDFMDDPLRAKSAGEQAAIKKKLQQNFFRLFSARAVMDDAFVSSDAATKIGLVLPAADTGQVMKSDGSTAITRSQVIAINHYIRALAPIIESDASKINSPEVDDLINKLDAITGMTTATGGSKTFDDYKADIVGKFTFAGTAGSSANPADHIDKDHDAFGRMKIDIGADIFDTTTMASDATLAAGDGIRVIALDPHNHPLMSGGNIVMKPLTVGEAKALEIEYKTRLKLQAEYNHARHELDTKMDKVGLVLARINNAISEAETMLGPEGMQSAGLHTDATTMAAVHAGAAALRTKIDSIKNDPKYKDAVAQLSQMQADVSHAVSTALSGSGHHSPHHRSVTPPAPTGTGTPTHTGTPSHRAATTTFPVTFTPPGNVHGFGTSGSSVLGVGHLTGWGAGPGQDSGRVAPPTMDRVQLYLDDQKKKLDAAIGALTALSATHPDGGRKITELEAARIAYYRKATKYHAAMARVNHLRHVGKSAGHKTSTAHHTSIYVAPPGFGGMGRGASGLGSAGGVGSGVSGGVAGAGGAGSTGGVGSGSMKTVTAVTMMPGSGGFSAGAFVPSIGHYLSTLASKNVTMNRYLLQRRGENNHGLWIHGDLPVNKMYLDIDNLYPHEDEHSDFGIGIDKSLSDKLTGGLFFSHANNKTDATYGVRQNTSSFILGAYGHYKLNNDWYISDKMSYNRTRFDNIVYKDSLLNKVNEVVETDSFDNEIALGYRVTPNFVVEAFHNFVYVSDTTFKSTEAVWTPSGMYNGHGSIKRIFNNSIGLRHYASSTLSFLPDDSVNSLRPYSKAFWQFNINGRGVKGKYYNTGTHTWYKPDFERINQHVMGAGAGLIWQNKNIPEFTGTVGYGIQYVSDFTSHVVTGSLSWEL